MRIPSRVVHAAPSGEHSKVVRQTSGLVPPRNQVRVEPSKVRLWVAGPLLLSRPMFLRLCPPRVLKLPPTRVFPSACTARACTYAGLYAEPFAPASKLVSSVPSALSRPTFFPPSPPTSVTFPPPTTS